MFNIFKSFPYDEEKNITRHNAIWEVNKSLIIRYRGINT